MQYFRKTIDQFYNDDRKKCNSKLPKQIANAMWGPLCQKNKVKQTTKKPLHLNNGELILYVLNL